MIVISSYNQVIASEAKQSLCLTEEFTGDDGYVVEWIIQIRR